MLRRLFVGLLLGLLVGVAVAAGLVKGLGMDHFAAPIIAYLIAAGTGMLTGLIAGKPIWSADGKIEAGLKAFFGALLAAGAMFALRKWGGDAAIDLSQFGAGHGALGDLPAAALPIVGGALGTLFELDNTESSEKAAPAKGARPNTRVASAKNNVRVSALEDDDLDDVPAPAAKKKR